MRETTYIQLESPFRASSVHEQVRNYDLAVRATRAVLLLGHVPITSHLFYTGVLDDSVAEERVLGMQAGFALARLATYCWVMVDHGVSSGMVEGIKVAAKRGVPICWSIMRGDKIEPCDPPELAAGEPLNVAFAGLEPHELANVRGNRWRM